MDETKAMFLTIKEQLGCALLPFGYGETIMSRADVASWTNSSGGNEYGGQWPDILLRPSEEAGGPGCSLVASFPNGGRFEQFLGSGALSCTLEHALAVLGFSE